MASKTNCVKNGVAYYRIRRKVGKKLNKDGFWVDDYKDFYGRNKTDAEKQFEEYKARKQAGILKENQYFGIMADYFISNVFIPDADFASGTKEKYISAWNMYVKPSRIAGLPLDLIHSADIQGFYNTLSCPHSSLKSINNLMKHFYRYIEQAGFGRDITGTLKLPAEEKAPPEPGADKIITWTDEEVEKILAGSADHQLRFLIVLAINTGLRISELLGLRYDDFDGNVLHVRRKLEYKAVYEKGRLTGHKFVFERPKYDSVRDVALNDTVLAELRLHHIRHLEQMMKRGYRTDCVFTTASGGFMDQRNVSRSLERLYAKLGVEKKSVHTYRFTFATKLCAMGVPIQTASALLGHSSISVTAKYYVNINIDEKLDAANRLRQAYFG